jgi:hypothetical protein
VWFAVCALAACSFRETVALSYVGVGLWMVCVPRRRRAGAVVLAGAGVYFLFVTGVVIPAFRGGTDYLGLERFAHLGDGLAAILLSPVLRPGAFWGSVFSQQSLVYAAVLFGCLGLVPVFRGGRRLLMLLPEGLFLLLWDEPLTRSIAYQYHAVLLVLLYWVALDCLPGAARGRVSAGRPGLRAWTMIGSAAAGSFLLGWWPGLRDTTPFELLHPRRATMEWVTGQIGEGDTVAATRRVAMRCLEAAELHILPEYDAAPQDWPVVLVLDYADDYGRVNLPEYLPSLRRWHRRLMDSDYVLGGARQMVAVYCRGGPQVQGRPELDQVPADVGEAVPIPISSGVSLLHWSLEADDSAGGRGSDRRVQVVAYMSIAAPQTVDLGIALALRLGGRPAYNVAHSGVRPAGGMLVPSTEWRTPCVIAERASMPWLMPIPPERADLELVVELYNLETGRLLTAALVR